MEEEDIQMEVENAAAEFCYKTNDGKFVYLDHTGLLKDLRKKLSHSNAKFAALQQDYKKLKYSLVASELLQDNNVITNKKNSMENFHDNTTVSDNIDLQTQLEQLKRSYNSLEAENISLLEQIGMQASNGVGSDSIVVHLRDENKILKGQLTEQEYYKDLLEEKKMQIGFLQSQIDTRIKKYHDSEQDWLMSKNEIEKLNSNLTAAKEETTSLQNELSQKQGDIENLLLGMSEKEIELNETKQALHDKQSQIVYIENVLLELRQQNELFNAAAADSEERSKILQAQLQTEEAKTKILEQKLKQNRQLIQRLYNEFSVCLSEENDESPVIALRTDYVRVTDGWEETAVH